jgi:hypothetical protein
MAADWWRCGQQSPPNPKQAISSNPNHKKKDPRPNGIGSNPPKEEGGGDNLAESLSDLRNLELSAVLILLDFPDNLKQPQTTFPIKLIRETTDTEGLATHNQTIAENLCDARNFLLFSYEDRGKSPYNTA